MIEEVNTNYADSVPYYGETADNAAYPSYTYEKIAFFTRYVSQRVSEGEPVEVAITEAKRVWSSIFTD